MGKWILADYLREYLKAETLKGIEEETQNSYNNKIRKRVGPALKDLTLIAKKQDRFSFKSEKKNELFEETIRTHIKELVSALLEPKTTGFNGYIQDYRAYERAKNLLEVVNGALNKILVWQRIQNMKLMPNSNLKGLRYRNIGALEMMFWAYSDLEKKDVRKES